MRPLGDHNSTVVSVRVPGPDGPAEVHVVLGRDAGGVLREVFVHGARGDRATLNGLCRLLSLALQRDEPVSDLVRMLGRQASGYAPVPWPDGGFILSLPDALARLLGREVRPEDDGVPAQADLVEEAAAEDVPTSTVDIAVAVYDDPVPAVAGEGDAPAVAVEGDAPAPAPGHAPAFAISGEGERFEPDQHEERRP